MSKFIEVTFRFRVNAPWKWTSDSYRANWYNLRLYPRFWVGKADNPQFRWKSIECRWGWWKFGIRKLNTEE